MFKVLITAVQHLRHLPFDYQNAFPIPSSTPRRYPTSSFTTTSTNLRWALFPAIVALSFYDITQVPPATSLDDIRVENGFGCFAAFRILSAAQYLFLLDIHKDLRRKRDAETNHSISNAGLYERFKWGLELFFNPRGVGWTHEPTPHLRWIPSQVTASKFKFILHQILRIAIFWLLYDLYKVHAVLNPYMHRDGPSFYEAPWYWRMTILESRIVTYVTLSQVQVVLSVIFVGLGIGSLRDWPTIHGSWKDAYTVRRFWGRSWHQMFRHTFQTYAEFVSGTLLKLSSDDLVTTYVELLTAFIISGLMHAGGDYRSFGTLTKSGSIPFFFLQALMITLEDALSWVARSCGIKFQSWMKYLGFGWVIFWFTWILPVWMDPIIRTGALEFTAEEPVLM